MTRLEDRQTPRLSYREPPYRQTVSDACGSILITKTMTKSGLGCMKTGQDGRGPWTEAA